MIWEKFGDFRAFLRQPVGLRIPGEGYYRAWCLKTKHRDAHFPLSERGLHMFLVSGFVALQAKKIHAEEQWELYRLAKDFALFSAIEGSRLEKKVFEKLLYPFYLAQRVMNPAAVRPFGDDADELMKTMKENMEFFEKGEVRITPTELPSPHKK